MFLASRCRARSRPLGRGCFRGRRDCKRSYSYSYPDLSCTIDQLAGGVFEIMLRRIQGRPRWTRAAGPNGNIGERTVSFFRFRERAGIHTSAQHVTTLSKLEERGMRDHTMCCRLPHIIRSGMPRMCDDGCIGRGRKLRQRQLPLRVLSWEPDALARRSDSDRLVDGRIGLGWGG